MGATVKSKVKVQVEQITLSVDEIAATFAEWDRRYREEPAAFETDFARIVRGQTVDEYGTNAGRYFAWLAGGLGFIPRRER